MDSISDSRLNTSNDSLGTTTGDSVPTHSNTIHADTPRPSAYDNTSMSDKSVDEEALQDDLLATQMQATASYLSGNISPQQKAAAIAAFHAMLSVAEGESEAKPLDLTESPPKSLMLLGIFWVVAALVYFPPFWFRFWGFRGFVVRLFSH